MRVNAQPASQPRRLADRYTLQEPIGYGGMGQVYRAHDEVLDRDVAVKLLGDAAAVDGDDLRRASLAEARAAAKLAHPGIVHVFDVGTQGHTSYVVMELVPGRPLQELVRQRGRLSAADAIGLVAQVADALDAAHRQGVIHCDVKPRNILVTADGRARLVDFGIARAATGTAPLPSDEIRGSAAYVAPEQVSGGRVDARTDLYALGAVLYELLTGRPPFRGETTAAVVAQRLVRDPPSPRSINPAIAPALDALIMRALARDPARRFGSAREMSDALRAVARGESASQGPTQAMQVVRALPRRATRLSVASPRRHRRMLVACVGVVVFALVLVAAGIRLQTARQVAPALVGRQLSEVPGLIENAGLAPGDVTVLTRPVERDYVGKVVDQQPQPGLPIDGSASLQIAIGVPRE